MEPALLSIVAHATQHDLERRTPTARAVYDAVRAHLDSAGHDEERADAHAHAARRAADQVPSARPDDEAGLHRMALREAGLALSLKPGHPAALEVVGELLGKPPSRLPTSAQALADHTRHLTARRGLREGAIARFSWLLYIPFIFWLGLKNVGLGILLVGLSMAAGMFELWASRHREPSKWVMRSAAVLALASMAPLSFVLGPYGLLPLVVLASLPALLLNLDRRGRHWATGAAMLVLVVPAALEWLGVFPAYDVQDEMVRVFPAMVWFDETTLRICMLTVCLACVLTSARLVGGMRDTLQRNELRLHAQSWQLRQLLPRATRESEDSSV